MTTKPLTQGHTEWWQTIEQAKAALVNSYDKSANVLDKSSQQAIKRHQMLTKRLAIKQSAYRDLRRQHAGKKSPTVQKRLEAMKATIDKIKGERHYCHLLKRGYHDERKKVVREKKQLMVLLGQLNRPSSASLRTQQKKTRSTTSTIKPSTSVVLRSDQSDHD